MARELWNLFVAFFRAGLFGYGGGPGSIPLIKAETVTTYQWLTPDQFAEALTFGNALPGPIATKLASYVGFRVAGVCGALVALGGIVAPTAIVMVGLSGLISAYRDAPWVRGMLAAVKPLVTVLLLQVAGEVGRGAFPGWPFYAVAGGAAIALLVFHLHPAVVIAVTLGVGALTFR